MVNFILHKLRHFEEAAIKPLEALQDEVSEVHESSKRWQRLAALADASAIKVAGLKKNSNKLDESEAELAELKKATAAAAIEFGTNLNTFSARRRLVLLDSACQFLELQRAYLDGYEKLLKDVLPELETSRAKIKTSLAQLPSAVAALPLAVLQDASISGYLQGYLYRKGKMGFTKRAYFILEHGQLSCYEDLDSEHFDEPKWRMDMLTSTVKPSRDANRNFCFEVISPHQKARTLQADSHETMNRWITAITESISAQLDKQRIAKPGNRRNSNASSNRSPAMTGSLPSSSLNAMSHHSDAKTSASGSSESKFPNSILQEADEELKKREKDMNDVYEAQDENKRCADCEEKRPIWLSLNLGILICLECSGIHRSMGTHISKVRSLTLDTLHSETKAYLLAVGNRVSNSVFGPDALTAIPTSFGERLHPGSTRKDREAWIKAKYAEKIFVETYRGQNIQFDLIAAIRSQDLPRCILLYAQGANLNFKYESNFSRQPIHYAADGDDPNLILFLLQNGASVNVQDVNGMTPLHIAAAGHVACAAMLCRHKARVDSLDSKGKSPVDVALDSQNADSITLLRLAKLATDKDGFGLDEKSFAEALDSFSSDIHKRSTSELRRMSPSSSSIANTSSNPSSNNLPMNVSVTNASESRSLDHSTDSASSTSDAASLRSSLHDRVHSSPISAIPRNMDSNGSANSNSETSSTPPSTSSPSTYTSSFSFSSKLDTKKR